MVEIKRNTLNLLHGKTVLPFREHLGVSQIGHSCDRYLWLTFRWCYLNEFDNRIIRLFDRGSREEKHIISFLESKGMNCFNEQETVGRYNSHFLGHLDGYINNVIEAPNITHVLEIKTMADKYFKKIQREGLKQTKPEYYAQVQVYMYLSLPICHRAFFIAVNKNDDNLYIERVKLDTDYAKELVSRAKDIILSEFIPRKVFDPTWWLCKYCLAEKVCHYNYPIEKNCRSCEFMKPIIEYPLPRWECKGKSNTMLQESYCENYQPIFRSN